MNMDQDEPMQKSADGEELADVAFCSTCGMTLNPLGKCSECGLLPEDCTC